MVCPAHNRSAAIVPTIRSALAQTERALEVIVVLDGCTDDTERWVREAAAGDARLRLVTTGPHRHPAEPRNIGLAEARGDLIAYLDHDDILHPDHLEQSRHLLGRGADIAATAFSHHDRHDAVHGEVTAVAMCWHPELQLMAPLFAPSTVAHRRGLVEAVGGWRSGPGLEDWDLWVRLSDAGARFATSLAVTSSLLTDPSTRRHHASRPHRMPLAVFATAEQAHRAATHIRSAESAQLLREDAVTDALAWYRSIAPTDRFVWPEGWAGDRAWGPTLADAIRDAVSAGGVGWLDDLVVVPHGRAFAVAITLWCTTTVHARRIGMTNARINRHQMRTVRRLCTAGGGSWHDPYEKGDRER